MMPTLSTREEILEAEETILRCLIPQSLASSQRKELACILAGYKWEAGEHETLFEVLLQSRIANTEKLREELPAILTRRGFPDVELAGYFAPEAPTAAEALRMARALAARTRGEQ
jgi:hypothetical protein